LPNTIKRLEKIQEFKRRFELFFTATHLLFSGWMDVRLGSTITQLFIIMHNLFEWSIIVNILFIWQCFISEFPLRDVMDWWNEYIYIYMCVCVCVCACVCVCMYVCVCVCMFKYVCMFVCVYIYIYIYIYICVCVCVCMYLCMYVCTYVRVYVRTYVCMYVGRYS